MPGPCSAPNGDKKLVADMEYRRTLAAQGKLTTGKTSKKNSK